MSLVYEVTYKCRMCGEKFAPGGRTGDPERAMPKIIADLEPMAPLLWPHVCKHDRHGIADLIGFRDTNRIKGSTHEP